MPVDPGSLPGPDRTEEDLYSRVARGSDSKAGSDGLSRFAADLLAWLRKESDWRSRSEAVEALGLSTSEWNQAIQELLAAGLAERIGEKRGTRYRAK